MARGGVVKRGKVLHLNRIRVEGESIRFPIHNLAGKTRKESCINIHGIDKNGKEICWEVSANAKYGHPGELAYKLDTLVINKRIDEVRNKGEIPKILKLGSLRDIGVEINAGIGGTNLNHIKKALLQNASVFIKATFTYITTKGKEQTFTAAFTRYDIILTGEILPGDRKADQVYAVLHDVFLKLLNTSPTRPLDYDYLKDLPPSSQRLYELVAPHMFATVRHKLPHAKYLYSSFCTFSGLTRHDTWEKVKKQMYKVMKPHKDSGYIASVNYEETIDSMGRIDWEMQIVPGERARKEHAVFTYAECTPKPEQKPLFLPEPQSEPTETQRIAEALRNIGVSGMKAQSLAQEFPERAKLWVNVTTSGCLSKRVKEPGAYLVKAIENDYAPPKAYRDFLKAKELPKPLSPPHAQTETSKREKHIDPDSDEYKEMCARFGVKPRR